MELVEDDSQVFECTAPAQKTIFQPQVANGAQALGCAVPISCYELNLCLTLSIKFYVVDRGDIEVNRFNPETTVGNIQLYQAILNSYVKYPASNMKLYVQNHPHYGMVGCLAYDGNATPFFSLTAVMREVDALLSLYESERTQLPKYFQTKIFRFIRMLEAYGYRCFSRCGIRRLGNQMSCYDPETWCEKRFKDCRQCRCCVELPKSVIGYYNSFLPWITISWPHTDSSATLLTSESSDCYLITSETLDPRDRE